MLRRNENSLRSSDSWTPIRGLTATVPPDGLAHAVAERGELPEYAPRCAQAGGGSSVSPGLRTTNVGGSCHTTRLDLHVGSL